MRDDTPPALRKAPKFRHVIIIELYRTRDLPDMLKHWRFSDRRKKKYTAHFVLWRFYADFTRRNRTKCIFGLLTILRAF